ncbi:hypothetical protein PMAYCL1PPCAC_01264 [Pristionchus mayeri]|uniref:Wrt-4 n=1 Tax=Pristionchus mayeri TaxID=1317129 RepID=A0AAN5C6T1_9BILA|nr:hypothetical protein PMAYCL1PPCAC_01264 [Pristionchus mayeri]
MLRLLTSSLLVAICSASFCGDSAIPYSVEVLKDGQPILGCARPTCFGWAPSGNPASSTGAFYRINDHADGFIRSGRDSIPAYGPADTRFYRPQTAVCQNAFVSSNCPAVNQWVGGIAPLLNVTAFPTTLQCCSFDGLLQSEDRGIATLKGGQIAQGGEVSVGGVQIAFDYISDVVKVVHADGSVQYDVAIRRMPCADLPQQDGAEKIPKTDGAAQAFQAPNLPVDQPLPLPQGPTGPPTNTILEEIVQEEAVQLPPGTQFQSVLQPPPPPQPIAFQAPQFVPQAVPAPYYSPPVQYAYSGGQAQWCFSEDMAVEMLDGSTKRMDQLQKKDWVLAVNEEQLEYAPVEFWLHRVPDQEADFNEIETEDGRLIKLTDKHYIFKGDCSRLGAGPVPIHSLSQAAQAVTADQVHAGDCLYTLDANRRDLSEARVVRTGRITQKGIYAPMTASGRIVVNGIHSSCHNIMQAHSMGHTVFGYVEAINRFYDLIFGVDPNAVVETPAGLNTMLAVADLVIPKDLATL